MPIPDKQEGNGIRPAAPGRSAVATTGPYKALVGVCGAHAHKGFISPSRG